MKRSLLPAALLLCAAGAHAAPVISEFLALNKGPDADDLGLTSDWIEIQNPDAVAVNLAGWTLTDEPDIRAKWSFPSVSVPAGGRLVVWASGKDRRDPANPLHTNFTLSGGGEFLALYPPAGDCTSCFQPYPKQFAGYSYGISPGGVTGYFASPTRGTANSAAVLTGYAQDTRFSADRGFYTAPFSVSLSCATPGAAIRYTTDGSEPEATSSLYTAPLTITATTTLRARAFAANLVPSNIDAQTYIFAANWVTQPVNPAGYSPTWGQASGQLAAALKDQAMYGMSAAVTGSADYSALMLPALTQTLPVLCITGGREQLFGNSGIQGDLRHGDAEVPVNVEYFNPQDTGDTFTARATLQPHGGGVRDHAKKGFRVDFSGAAGSGPLGHPLFPGSSVESHDQLVLRPGGHDSFSAPTFGGSQDGLQLSFHASYLRDQFMRRTENEAGLISPRGRFVHLCLNGLYWGVYDLHERPNAELFSSYAGGAPAEWDVLHHSNFSTSSGNQLVDGTAEAWQQLLDLCSSPVTTNTKYRQITSLLGPDAYIDHLLIRMWAGDHDWLGPVYTPGVTAEVTRFRSKNWYAARSSRAAAPGPWRFFTWDGEISMGNHLLYAMIDSRNDILWPVYSPNKLDLDLTGISQAETPAAPWAALKSHPEFRVKVADRAQRLLFGSGLLSPAKAAARTDSLIQQLDLPIVAESARWGNSWGFGTGSVSGAPVRTFATTPVRTRNTHWRPEVAWLRDTFCAQRGATLRDQLRARGLYPVTEPPDIALAAGELTLTTTAGTIYYTLTGNDPRQQFGSLDPDNQIYTDPVPAPSGTFTVSARVFNGFGEWSPLQQVTFTAAVPPTAGALAISEVYYNPAAPAGDEITAGFTDADSFEFLEITNVSSVAVALDSLRFAAGVDFDFARHSSLRELAAGESLLLVSDAAAFAARFGNSITPAGEFQNGTNLSNSGERLKLVTGDGTLIAEFSYNDSGTWPAGADGGGESLELLAPLSGTDENDGDHWRSGAPTPGTVPTTLSYADWLHDYFTPDEVTAGILTAADADPDGDSLTNLMEYFTRLNPRRVSTPPVKFSQAGAGTVQFTWERRADAEGVTGVAQISSPLAGWVTAVNGPGVAVSDAPTDRGTVLQTITFTLPAAGSRKFVRLKITAP